ncbi:MAG: beta-lactamase family protein [Acidobacteria bacterium]|nr:beta-lactamase family protein [Acidobacteriota bacterium]
MRNTTLLAFLAVWTLAAAPPANVPAKAKMDAERIARITPRLQSFVDKGTIAGAVGLAARHGEIAYFDAVGYQDLEAKKPMRKDSIFQIMSMTKPVTAVGIMLLLEEGKLALSDTVEKHLPEFRGQWVIESRSADGKSRAMKRPGRAITIRDLLTHTSGLSYGPPEGAAELNQKMHLTLAEAVHLYSQQSLDFEPGSRWQYSNMGIAVLGRIIEVAADQPYEKFLEDRIFKPLGMKDSFFFPPPEKAGRIAMVYKLENGKLKRSGGDILGGEAANYRQGAKYPAPEWGLYTTAADLHAFYQAILSGRKILSRPTIDVMTSLHTGDIEPAGHSPGMGYGLAWTVVRDPLGTLQLQSKGSYGHGGAFGTQGWVDPAKDLIGVFMIQRSGGGDPGESKAFMNMVGAAVE